MPGNFTAIGLIGKRTTPIPAETLQALTRFLHGKGCRILLESRTSEQLSAHGLEVTDIDRIGRECDLAIVIGGDGTLLHSARSLADHGIPLLGINLGRLGFLADVSPREMLRILDQVFAGNYREESRFLLAAEIDGEHHKALNDVVIHKWNIARMIEFETYVDGSFVDAQRSDGLIISTPTGSTAYALSGGGPILLPDLNATVLVPICPHTLSNRPIVLSGDSVIEVVVCNHTDPAHVRITCDGQDCLALSGERIRIQKHANPVRLIHPQGHDHFNILRAKLGWGEHPS